MKYKMVISDYDGTLGLAPKNDIHPETLCAINKFIEKGGVFSVCSGREYRSVRKICLEQGLKGLVVSFQGAQINDIESGKTIYSGGLDSEIAVKIIKEVEDSGLSPIVYTADAFFISKRCPYSDHYENAVNMKAEIADVKEIARIYKKVCKLGWLGDDKIVDQVAKKMNEKYKGNGVSFNSGAPCLLEAINPECSKGQAVRFLANYYNIPLKEVLAVGDSTNDVDLISGEWHGVAVGDGREELKAVADEVTVPFSEKPVKVLIEKYCL